VQNIVYIDIETSKDKNTIFEIGLVYQEKILQTSSILEVKEFLSHVDTHILCGHNIIDFDTRVLKDTSLYAILEKFEFIDTLPLSLLILNDKTLHKLPKPYKIGDIANNPIEDAKNSAKLLQTIIKKYNTLDKSLQMIYIILLNTSDYFKSFFNQIIYIDKEDSFDYEKLASIVKLKYPQIDLDNLKYFFLNNKKVELAYIFSLLNAQNSFTYPPAVLYKYTDILEVHKKLLKKIDDIDIKYFSKEIFGFDNFREFPKIHKTIFSKSKISQYEIIKATLEEESFLAVLPTGGGKTFTFWLPALINASRYKSLTVIISPLQALIEDHITTFNRNIANFKAVAISGFLSPLQRAESINDVISGEADILYIAPESLRSNTIFNILKNRYIDRFVIDEAHCLSIWGNDFRQDYYYICEYIKDLLQQKPFQSYIPISCFTATAKPSVIDDIHKYFENGLDINLNDYLALPQRDNLEFYVENVDKKEKYTTLLKLLNSLDGSTLIYIPSSTKECDEIAKRLSIDTNKEVASFHSKKDSDTKRKILQDYIDDRIDIVVATTAFGMGVDKPNIKNVIHYEISDSLENYVQEAGRGARDSSLIANCVLMYDEADLDKHFFSLNRSKLSVGEINSIFKVLKKHKTSWVYKTAYELAVEAGWDVEDSSSDYDTKIKTVLLELEREGYINRKRNKVQFFADSIDPKAIEKIYDKLKDKPYSQEEKDILILIVQTFMGKGKLQSIEIDEVSYLLGLPKEQISYAILQLKDLGLLGDNKDLSLRCSHNSLKKSLDVYKVEIALYEYLISQELNKFAIRELNQYLLDTNIVKRNESNLIKIIFKDWKLQKLILFNRLNRENDIWKLEFKDADKLEKYIQIKYSIINKIVMFFKSKLSSKTTESIEFSLIKLREFCIQKYTYKQIDKQLLFLHKIHAVDLLYGRFIAYMPMQIQLNEKIFNRRKYLISDYQKRLLKHYLTKIESIHIIGKYAKELLENQKTAKIFMKDYFTLNYDKFKKKYKLLKEQIQRPMTLHRYNRIYNSLSLEQKRIVEDKKSKAMMILAGPGSGKTKTLVHKIAALILNEDIQAHNFTMLTFSNSAKWEFKSRLVDLIGSVAYDVEIQTFHSYALKLIGQSAKHNSNVLNDIVSKAIRSIEQDNITLPFISVLILDEYQDINEDGFLLIQAIYQKYEKDLRIIAVGDDDQCIMQHSGAHIQYINKFEKIFEDNFSKYELLTNYRSDKNIVDYSNWFIKSVKTRYKTKPLKSASIEMGKVSIISYQNTSNLTPCILDLISKEVDKTYQTLILAYTNEEVLSVYSSLMQQGINCRYLLTRQGFQVKNILEVYELNQLLMQQINDMQTKFSKKDFINALDTITQKYKYSKTLDLLYKIVEKFLSQGQEYYISEWIGYLDDINLEDFEKKDNILISTIHKSKGMEFNKVYLLVSKQFINDDIKRLYYVGMTRAKHELNILRIGKDIQRKLYFVDYITDKKTYIYDNKTYVFVMSLEDIFLGFDNCLLKEINLYSGLKVEIKNINKFHNLCLVYNQDIVGILSQKFSNKLKNLLQEGFSIKSCIIEFIVLWYDETKNKHLKHPLCKIVVSKSK
jgi:ATP-dependent DNA helicase RecQ